MAQLCSQLIVLLNKANFHISDHPHVVYGNALSQHPAGFDLVYTRDVPGSSSSTSLKYLGTLPGTLANSHNTGILCDFGNVTFRFFCFSFRIFRFLFRLNFSIFRFLCRVFRFLFRFFPFLFRHFVPSFSRVEFGHITWATGAGCGFLSDCNLVGESLFGANKGMLQKHWKNPKRRKVENWVLENRVWALQRPVISIFRIFCICRRRWRNTVSRVLFRRRELTEPHWVLQQTRWVLQKTRSGHFQVDPRKSLSSLRRANTQTLTR